MREKWRKDEKRKADEWVKRGDRRGNGGRSKGRRGTECTVGDKNGGHFVIITDHLRW